MMSEHDNDDLHDGHDGHDDHDDHGHGAIELEYQEALPINNGKVCLWLFLSTEIMFFAALIGTYIVLRFGVSGIWPAPHDVHVIEFWGALNTFVLICSSVSIVLALEEAKVNEVKKAWSWMAVTLVLGCLFLGVKAMEYNSKFEHGIYPQRPRSLIHERADVYYVAAVREARAVIESENLTLSLAAVGGVSSVADFSDFLGAGADAVLCGSSPMYLPDLAIDIKSKL